MWGLATPVTLAILRCTQRAAVLSQQWALRWFLPQLSERLFRWLPTHARADLNRTMANSRRLRRQILIDHMDPPIVYLGDDGVDESRPHYNHAHPSRSELGEHRGDWFRPKSVRRMSRALSRTRSPSRSARARWSSQARPASVVRVLTVGEPGRPHLASYGAASSSAAQAPAVAPAQHRVEPWPAPAAAQPQVVHAQAEQTTQQPLFTMAVLRLEGQQLESLGPTGVCPRLDSHALLPLPKGWILCHDNSGRLYRARKDPPLSQWRHPARDDDPVPLRMPGVPSPMVL